MSTPDAFGPRTSGPSGSGPEAGLPPFARGYAPLQGTYDEMMAPDGTVRQHWASFLKALALMPEGEVARRWRRAERLLRENGLTYDLPGGGEGTERPWELDAMPLLIPAAEWRLIEEAVIQRARLLNALLGDLYGPQTLLKSGALPAAAVLGNPRFLRPVYGIEPPDGIYLSFLAVDLGRGPDGRWWVLGDHTEVPTDGGYALENRIIVSQCFPDLFRASRVERLALHFRAMDQALVARTGRDNPRIVLLSPGPDRPGYFADAYLARYLGYTLAEGPDLTVRDNRLFLKTIDGLRPVDLVLRRIEPGSSDPLELGGDAAHGVPGLLQAIRGQTVVVANGLGAALVESPAFMAFHAPLCQRLLNEDLKLPNTATWWCGDAAARAHVLANLSSLAIMRMAGAVDANSDTVFEGTSLPPERLAELAREIASRGHEFVAQELVTLSTTPVWRDGAMTPLPMSLRVFAAATEDGYSVLPGGLARITETRDARAIALQGGDGSKDTWILAEGPVSTFSILQTRHAEPELRRTGKDLPSRAADNLFWLGRYAERAENLMRVLLAGYRQELEDAGEERAPMTQVLEVLIGEDTKVERSGAIEGTLRQLMIDPDAGDGLVQTLGHLVRTAWLARDRLSLDAWSTLNRFRADQAWRDLGLAASPPDPGEAVALLEGGIRTLAAFAGLSMENMTRSQGWRFLDVGRRIERAQHLVELFRALLLHGDPEESGALLLLLELCDSIITYRSRYLTTPQLAPVLDLLLLDEANPRSLGYQVTVLASQIDALPRDAEQPGRTSEQRIALALQTAVRLADTRALVRADSRHHRPELRDLLEEAARALPLLSDRIALTYFSHVDIRRPQDVRLADVRD